MSWRGWPADEVTICLGESLKIGKETTPSARAAGDSAQRRPAAAYPTRRPLTALTAHPGRRASPYLISQISDDTGHPVAGARREVNRASHGLSAKPAAPTGPRTASWPRDSFRRGVRVLQPDAPEWRRRRPAAERVLGRQTDVTARGARADAPFTGCNQFPFEESRSPRGVPGTIRLLWTENWRLLSWSQSGQHLSPVQFINSE